MLIVCPNCSTSYTIEPIAVGTAGRTVRCARCKATWFAGGPASEPNGDARDDIAIVDAKASSAPVAQSAADGVDAAAFESPPLNGAESPPAEPPPSQPALAPDVPEPALIADAPPLVPPIEQSPPPDAAGAELDSEDAESFAARRLRLQARRKQTRRSSRWTAVILVLVAFNVALVGARNDVVRYLPQTASLFAAIGLPVNLRHLKFENVRISREVQDGGNVLVVQGDIVSDAGKPTEVPRLRFAARNATGQEIYTWTAPPARSILGPGERQDFRSQVSAPLTDARDVIVRFLTAQDSGAK